MKTSVLARQKTWPRTELLLASLTSDQLLEAASQAENHQPITNAAVKELLKGVNRVGTTACRVRRKKILSPGSVKVIDCTFRLSVALSSLSIPTNDIILLLYYMREKKSTLEISTSNVLTE